MAGKKSAPPPPPFDFTRFQEELRSPDADTRARAARQICPCRLGWEVFERCMKLVEPLRKDPSPEVRRAALHVFEDAFEMQSRGLPTTPQAVTNQMVARRRETRWGDDEREPEKLGHRGRQRSRPRRNEPGRSGRYSAHVRGRDRWPWRG